MLVLNTIAPIALIILLGAVLRRSGFVSKELFLATNRLVFYVGIPCLLFNKTAQATGQYGPGLRVFLVLLAGMVVCIALGYAAAWALRLPRPSVGSFVQGAYRGNLAYVGLPVVFFGLAGLSGANGTLSPAFEQIAVLSIAPLIPIYNIVAVLVLVAGQPHGGRSIAARFRHTGFRIVTNPLVLACVAGIAWSLTGWTLPVVVDRTTAALGQMALPLALLGIGATLSFTSLRGHWLPATASSVIKVGVAPAVGWLVGRTLGLPTESLLIAMLFLGCPTAVVSWVMAEQLDADKHLSGSIVVLSTLLAMVSLSIILMMMSG